MDFEKLNFVNLGEDFVDFIFNKYEKWIRELPKIIHVYSALIEATEMPNISKIVLTYIDVFEISIDGFEYNNYFTFPIINKENNWDIKFHDLFLGFVPSEDYEDEDEEKPKIKTVLRLKSRGIKEEKYIFRLESVGSIDNCSISPNPDILK